MGVLEQLRTSRVSGSSGRLAIGVLEQSRVFRVGGRLKIFEICDLVAFSYFSALDVIDFSSATVKSLNLILCLLLGKTKENSPICARLAETVRVVFKEYLKK